MNERFSGFALLVGDLLTSNTAPIQAVYPGGYVGNPRIGKCTYPTVTWSMTGIPIADSNFHYGNLNATDPVITLRG